MFKDREKLYQIYHTILSMALTWALTLAINQYFELRVHIMLCAIFSFVPALLIYLFDLNKKNLASYLLVLSLFPIAALIFWVKKLNPIDWIRDLFDWCAKYNGTDELYVGYHANVVILAVGCVGAIVFYLITKKQLYKVILAVIIIVIMIALSISKVDINKAVVGICVFYILTIILEVYGIIYSRKAGRQDKKEGILYLAPICLLLAVLSIAFPSKPEPIQWTGIKNVYYDVKEQIEIWRTELNYYFGKGQGEFFVSLTGYSENGGELGNSKGVVKDNKVALKVSGMGGNKSVYLIGSISDEYTGRSWEKSRLDYLPEEKEYLLDYNELIYALSRQDTEVFENNRLVERRIMKIEYNNIKTKTFFYPIKMSSFEVLAKKVKLLTEPSNIVFEKVRGKGTTYENTFYEMNLQGEAFQQMLREADSFSYASSRNSLNFDSLLWLQNNSIFKNFSASIFSKGNYNEILGARAIKIKEQYTNLPITLPDRVRDLAEEITADYDTTYDKLKAIEEYLRTYEYTLQPGGVPEGEDFTDYFLFENKAGYCTSYATAMAVLGRCIGVPTRYVEGFIASFKSMNEDNMFPIKNSQAHAWAEAYIEGIGWIPFEATAPFYEIRYTEWPDFNKKGGVENPSFANQYEQYMHEGDGTAHEEGNPLEIEKKDTTKDVITGFIIFLLIIVILLITLIIYYYVLGYRYKKDFHKADYSRKMYMLFLRILNLLKQEGFVLGQQETIQMLSMRVKDRFQYERVVFPDVATIFMHYRYAEEEVTKEEFDKVAVYQLGLSNIVRGKQNRLKIWWEELLFLTRKGYH